MPVLLAYVLTVVFMSLGLVWSLVHFSGAISEAIAIVLIASASYVFLFRFIYLFPFIMLDVLLLRPMLAARLRVPVLAFTEFLVLTSYLVFVESRGGGTMFGLASAAMLRRVLMDAVPFIILFTLANLVFSRWYDRSATASAPVTQGHR